MPITRFVAPRAPLFTEWMGRGPVVSGPEIMRLSDQAASRLSPADLAVSRGVRRPISDLRPVPFTRLPDFRFFALGDRVRMAVHEPTRRVAFKFGDGEARFPWTHPDFRGRGVASEALWATYALGGHEPGTTYTKAGFRTWLSAHRLVVERGGPDPDEDLYVRQDDGTLRQRRVSMERWNEAALPHLARMEKYGLIVDEFRGAVRDPEGRTLKAAVGSRLLAILGDAGLLPPEDHDPDGGGLAA